MTDQFVLVGGGLAAAMAAQTLREQGFTGAITLIAGEAHLPYERPALSKEYLTAAATRDDLFVHSADWYPENQVTLLSGTAVTGIDPAAHTVTTADGTDLRYTKLLLATGAAPRPLPVPGADLPGLHYLRVIADADRLRPELRRGARIVVVGGGWIGLEVAAAARTAGAEVTVVEMTTLPLQRVLGREVARIFVDLHRAHGVRIITGASVRQLHGTGRVEAVELADGTRLPADVVVVGIGAWPVTELAEAAGLDVRDGVVTDASLRTSDPDIYAAGDIANAWHPVLDRHLRVEHWANARHSGAAAARAMLGQPVSYDRTPYFYTDQYDLGMEYRGHAEPGSYNTVVFRGPTEITDEKTPAFHAFWTQDGRVVAAMNVNSWDDGEDLEALVQAGLNGRAVDLDRLANPEVALSALLT